MTNLGVESEGMVKVGKNNGNLDVDIYSDILY